MNNNRCNIAHLFPELLNHLFEINIIRIAIEHFLHRNLSAFDSSVGDWKCQTRTSIIIDLMQNAHIVDQELTQELAHVEAIIANIETVQNRLSSIQPHLLFHQEFKNLSVAEFFTKNTLDYDPSENVRILSLCFITTLKNAGLPIFSQINKNKLKNIINTAKVLLSEISINYERLLAEKYSSSDIQTSLQQIESQNNSQKMTALFSSFKTIFAKMKSKQQPFILHSFIFCACGGLQDIQLQYFALQNDQFGEAQMPLNTTQAITIIEVYQFPGSLEKLQNILGVPDHNNDIPLEYHRACLCLQPTQKKAFDCIEKALCAFFAIHPQFTNGAAIDFKGLELEGSPLQIEYNSLLTLQGFGRGDMTVFHINHMYPSTIAEFLFKVHSKNLFKISVSVYFRVLLNRFLIFFRGVVSTSYTTPRKKIKNRPK